MTTTLPTAITSDGNQKVQVILAIADTANPTEDECNAVSAFDLSCYLTKDGWSPTTNENAVTDGRLCSVQTFEDRGTFTDQLQIKYVYQAQDPTAADNKAYGVLVEGASVFLAGRFGTSYEIDLAAGDWVDVYPVRCGVQQKLAAAENEKLKIQQTLFVTGPVQRRVQVVS